MRNAIKISPRFGVNPTIPVCFWCGNEKNEVALMGYLRNDTEAPRNAVIDYTPCEECCTQMKRGFLVIAATREPNGVTDMPLSDGVFPTGKWSVIKHEVAKRLFGKYDKPIAYMEDELYAEVFERG